MNSTAGTFQRASRSLMWRILTFTLPHDSSGPVEELPWVNLGQEPEQVDTCCSPTAVNDSFSSCRALCYDSRVEGGYIFF